MIMYDIHDKTSLISNLFLSIKIPEQTFEPENNWEHKYFGIDTYSAISNPKIIRKRIELTIDRKNQTNGFSNLTIKTERFCKSNFFFYADAELKCKNDEISTPLTWIYESKVAKRRSDTPYLKSGMKKNIKVAERKLIIETGEASSKMELPGSYTCKWCLLDSVQRMPKVPDKSIEFKMIDEYDSIIGDQTLRFREAAKTETANGMKDVFCFELLGSGTIPATYWIDSSGRLLFYISGMELLVLTEENGKTVIPISIFSDWQKKSTFDLTLPG